MHYFLNFQGFQIILADLKMYVCRQVPQNLFNVKYAFPCKNILQALSVSFVFVYLLSSSWSLCLGPSILTTWQDWLQLLPSLLVNTELSLVTVNLQHCSTAVLCNLIWWPGNHRQHCITLLHLPPTNQSYDAIDNHSLSLSFVFTLSWWTTCLYCVQSFPALFSTTLHCTCLQSVM